MFKQTHFSANGDMQLHRVYCYRNWYSAGGSNDEQLPEDGLVRSKHAASNCDFNDISKYRRECEPFLLR
jgi:hypothetical protein